MNARLDPSTRRLFSCASLGLALAIGACGSDIHLLASGEGGSSEGSGTPDPGDGGRPSDAGRPSDGGRIHTDGCPESLPAPKDCGDFAIDCGTATPLAAGWPARTIRGAALTADAVFFAASCGGPGPDRAVYRVAKSGGDAQWATATDTLEAFEADDEALYLIEGTDDPSTTSVRAVSNGASQAIGALHVDPAETSYWSPSLTRTAGGIVTYDYDAFGPIYPSFFHVTPSSVEPIAAYVGTGHFLGSAPAFDGQRLVFSWYSVSVDDPAPDRLLVSVVGNAIEALATNANAWRRETVAVDAENIFFVTGDYSRGFIGVSRMAKSGGPATSLFSSNSVDIGQIFVDDADVYFTHSGGSDSPYTYIAAVPKSGGEVREVWQGGNRTSPIRADADSLYFSLEARKGGDVPGPGGLVVRVPKHAIK